MEVQTQSQTAARASTTQTAGTGQSASALSSDFQTFLRMLTVQMENQDPLNPIESSDFAVQLATFSGVEQQIRTNDLLADMIAGQGLGGLAQLAGWIGMEARVPGPAQFSGAPIPLAPQPDPASDAAYLVVKDEFGRAVSREAVPLSDDVVLWGGTASNGAPLLPGRYSFELESLRAGEITSIKPVEHYALVQEARLGPGGIEIVLEGGRALSSADVTALRRP